MKLKYDFVINNVAGETVAVSVGNTSDAFNGYIKLNETGAFIFAMLKNDVTRDELIDNLIKKYSDATENDAADSVDSLLEELKKADLLI